MAKKKFGLGKNDLIMRHMVSYVLMVPKTLSINLKDFGNYFCFRRRFRVWEKNGTDETPGKGRNRSTKPVSILYYRLILTTFSTFKVTTLLSFMRRGWMDIVSQTKFQQALSA